MKTTTAFIIIKGSGGVLVTALPKPPYGAKEMARLMKHADPETRISESGDEDMLVSAAICGDHCFVFVDASNEIPGEWMAAIVQSMVGDMVNKTSPNTVN
jgi:hypothetical protein